MEARRFILGGHRNFIGKGADRIALINCRDCFVPWSVTGLVAVNCSGKIFATEDCEKVYVDNRIQISRRSTTAGASVPTTLSASYGMIYVNDTGGNVTINLPDPAQYIDCEWTLYRTTAGGNLIRLYAYGSENIQLAVSPATIIPNQGNSLTITTNGTDWFFKSEYD